MPPTPDALRLSAAETLTRAQELLDDDCPFQAHEVLEARWKTCPAEERPYWQGLAQAAVALTHLRRGNPLGARRLATRATARLTAADAPADTPQLDAVLTQLAAIATGHDRGLKVTP